MAANSHMLLPPISIYSLSLPRASTASVGHGAVRRDMYRNLIARWAVQLGFALCLASLHCAASSSVVAASGRLYCRHRLRHLLP
ncbi:hypothetical protein V8C86DRAFT_763329 [Haematococcus lacustris]